MFKPPLGIRAIHTKIDFALLPIITLPLLLLSVNKNWFFNYQTIIDPWVYFGYFLRFEQYTKAFAGTYYGTRLSWIVPGHLTYKWLPPLLANYVLHLMFYYAAAISIYLILKLTVGRRAALLTTVFMGCYSYFLLAIGWNYVDGAGITYFLLVTLMLTKAALGSRQQAMFLSAGIFYSALLYTNIFWIVLTPSFAAYYWLLQRYYQRGSPCNHLISSVLYFALGFLIVTVIFGVISYTANGPFFFYFPSINMAATYPNKPNPSKAELRNWLPFATWLLLPLFTLFGSCISLWSSRTRFNTIRFSAFNQSSGLIFQLYFIVNALILVILHLTVNPILQFFYYASFLIPSTFLALGAQLSMMMSSLRTRHYILFVGITYSLLILAYTSWVDSSLLFFLGILLLCVVAAWALSSYFKGRSSQVALSFFGLVLFFSIFCFSNRPNWQLILGNEPSNRQLVSLKPTADLQAGKVDPDGEDGFLATVKAQEILKAIDPNVKLFFWYSLKESSIYRAVASASLWGYRLVGENFPTLEPPIINPDQPIDHTRLIALLKQNSKVVILSKQPDAFQQAAKSLAEVGFNANYQAKFDIQQGEIRYSMITIEAVEKRQ